MEVSAKTEDRFCVVSVMHQRIDAAAALEFKEAMRQTTADAPNVVILDLHRVDFIDSSGLGAIVATMKHLAPQRSLVLAGLTPAVEKVFKLTRMDSVFSVFNTLDAALSAQSV
jgi:anti-sigma B factor antagonist|tara:strand:+ start:50300 stop:50638 length:339 start_codon:yes stop_codon:yes gene_type:complete